MTYRHVGPEPDELPDAKEKREIAVHTLVNELKMYVDAEALRFTCDNCEVKETCIFAYDPDCLWGYCVQLGTVIGE